MENDDVEGKVNIKLPRSTEFSGHRIGPDFELE
jgi:hypothetical protein